MNDSLKVGDIIVVFNPLAGEREYPVKRIEGNKAITNFRTFNKRIYPGNNIFEYGKKQSPIYNNGYWVKIDF